MNQQHYQTNLLYNGATAIAMPMQPSILQPSLLEQKLYGVTGNITQKGKESIVGGLGYLDGIVTAAATTLGHYQTSIVDYIQIIGCLLFSKKRKAIEKQKKEAERATKKSDKSNRMQSHGGSRYAKKQDEPLPPEIQRQYDTNRKEEAVRRQQERPHYFW